MRIKKDLPKSVSLRKLAENKIINRCTSYNMRRKGANIEYNTAKKICDFCELNINEYFEPAQNLKTYSSETVKNHRSVLRAVFNEAVRYEWIIKNPVCLTRIGGDNNITLRPVPEKEVFSISEAKDFIKKLDLLSDDLIYQKVIIKMLLLTGLRTAEMHGLRWSDINFDARTVRVSRNRLYTAGLGTYEKEPKTRTSERVVPLPDVLVDDLKRYYD